MAEKRSQQQKTISKTGAPTAPPPAYFLSLTVGNLRCFGPKQTLDLSIGKDRPASWTVILGNNGVGKTTLLQCLSALQPKEETEGNLIGAYTPKVGGFWSAHLGQQFANVFPHPFCSVQIAYGKRLAAKSRPKTSDIFYMANPFYLAQTGSGSWGINYIKKTDQDIGGLICYGYGASRRMGTGSLSESGDSDSCASLFDDNTTLINAEEWLLQADYAASRDGDQQQKAKARRDQIKEILVQLLPDVSDIRISQATKGFSSFVEVKTPYGWVPIQGLSLGYRTLIAWMVDFASRLFERYPDSENPLAEPAVCLVDEIDLHLHPQWQRTLMSFLSERFPNTQFIATAHSPLVVQAAHNANIVVLRREGNHVVIDNDVQSIKNWRVDQILTSELFDLPSARPPDLDAAMKERQKILSKARLTKADKARLQELEKQIGELPTGETPADIEAMDIIRRAAELLKAEGVA